MFFVAQNFAMKIDGSGSPGILCQDDIFTDKEDMRLNFWIEVAYSP